MFDIYFPTDYPTVPPLVLITTTGEPSVDPCSSSQSKAALHCSIEQSPCSYLGVGVTPV